MELMQHESTEITTREGNLIADGYLHARHPRALAYAQGLVRSNMTHLYARRGSITEKPLRRSPEESSFLPPWPRNHLDDPAAGCGMLLLLGDEASGALDNS